MKNFYDASFNLTTILGKKQLLLFILMSTMLFANGQTVSDFENLTLNDESYYDGSDLSGGFASGDAYFYNKYNTTYQSWSGFAYANRTDVTSGEYTNPYSAFTGEGYNQSKNFVVANVFGTSGLKLTGSTAGTTITGFFATNTTYAALTMKNGDAFNISTKFGGESGDVKDWFKLTINGYLNNNASTTSVDFYLADYRFDDNSRDYILNTWKWVDLRSLGKVDSLSFTLTSSDNGEWGMNTPAYFAMDNFNNPLFAPPVGQVGTTALSKNDLLFKGWATACTVVRGPQNIANPTGGNASVGDNTLALGQAGSNGIVSLGDGGSATLTFLTPIANGEGADFAVFENSFSDDFLELAFVEVSSDGINFFRFPATSLVQDNIQLTNAGLIDARLINNLAGKYRAGYGTPFDLEELKSQEGLNVNNITHVRIVDVVGSLETAYATFDAYGNKVNDPWTTAFASGGFDLDAVGVINTSTSTGIATAYDDTRMEIYPNPTQKNELVTIRLNTNSVQEVTLQIYDHAGQLIKEEVSETSTINISTYGMLSGMYMVKLSNEESIITKKLIVR